MTRSCDESCKYPLKSSSETGEDASRITAQLRLNLKFLFQPSSRASEA